MSDASCPLQPSGFSTNIRGSVSARLICTGGQPAQIAADGNNSTPVATEIYLGEIWVPAPVSVTGISVFNGSDVTDNIKVALYDSNGIILASSVSTVGSGTDAYQRVPFAYKFSAVTSATVGTSATFDRLFLQPGTYYIATDYASNTSRYNTFAVGNFGASKVTSAVFATAFITTSLIVAVPTTFTTNLANIASLY